MAKAEKSFSTFPLRHLGHATAVRWDGTSISNSCSHD
jgi:hypothetical protein